MQLRVVQINLHHSASASLDLMKFISDKALDVALIQEPWLVKSKVSGLGLDGYRLYVPQTEGKVRTCIIARNYIKLFLLTPYSSGDLTTVVCEHRHRRGLLLTSAYLPYDEAQPPPQPFRQLVAYAQTHGLDLVAGCDANGHHQLWGSSDTNARGESIFDFIISTNLLICNKGNDPTFRNRIRQEVIDITLATDSITTRVKDWRVSDVCSFSDHSRILFNVETSVEVSKPFRNPRKANWENFSSLARQRLAALNVEIGRGNASIDRAVDRVTRALSDSFRQSCTLTRPRSKPKPVWWSAELGELRAKARKLFNVAKRRRTEEDWDNYRAAFNSYKSNIRTAKTNSWKKFC